jgi:C-terminal processing protease CtpA/Prc
LVKRPDYNGYGFKTKRNETGPHQILDVETNSPAADSGLLSNDYILKIGDVNVIGEGYNSTLATLKNQAGTGRFKMEVVDSVPLAVKNLTQKRSSPDQVSLSQSQMAAAVSPTVSQTNKQRSGSTENLRDINRDIRKKIAEDNKTQSLRIDDRGTTPSNNNRGVSVDTGIDRNKVTIDPATNDPASTTLKSTKSFGSAATGLSAAEQPPVPQYSSRNEPKFKRCRIELDPSFDGFGFGLNPRLKPKYTVFRVDPSSPAYAANLRATDVIVEVDSKNIRRFKFEKVTQLLKDAQKKGFVEVLVISRDGYAYLKKKNEKFSNPKLVTSQNVEYYPDQMLQLRDDIRIGDNIEPEQALQSNLKKIVKEISDQAAVASKTEDRYQQQQPQQQQQRDKDEDDDKPNDLLAALTSAAGLAALGNKNGDQLDTIYDPSESYTAYICDVKRRDDYEGLGLVIQTKKIPQTKQSPAEMQVVTNVLPGSPAALSGLQKGDVILEINGKSAVNQEKPKVASWIRSSDDNIRFTVHRKEDDNKAVTVAADDSNRHDQARIIANQVIDSAKQRAEENQQQQQHQPTKTVSSPSDGIENLRKITQEILDIGRRGKHIDLN